MCNNSCLRRCMRAVFLLEISDQLITMSRWIIFDISPPSSNIIEQPCCTRVIWPTCTWSTRIMPRHWVEIWVNICPPSFLIDRPMGKLLEQSHHLSLHFPRFLPRKMEFPETLNGVVIIWHVKRLLFVFVSNHGWSVYFSRQYKKWPLSEDSLCLNFLKKENGFLRSQASRNPPSSKLKITFVLRFFP